MLVEKICSASILFASLGLVTQAVAAAPRSAPTNGLELYNNITSGVALPFEKLKASDDLRHQYLVLYRDLLGNKKVLTLGTVLSQQVLSDFGNMAVDSKGHIDPDDMKVAKKFAQQLSPQDSTDAGLNYLRFLASANSPDAAVELANNAVSDDAVLATFTVTALNATFKNAPTKEALQKIADIAPRVNGWGAYDSRASKKDWAAAETQITAALKVAKDRHAQKPDFEEFFALLGRIKMVAANGGPSGPAVAQTAVRVPASEVPAEAPAASSKAVLAERDPAEAPPAGGMNLVYVGIGVLALAAVAFGFLRRR